MADAVTLAMVGTAASSIRLFPQARLAVSGAPPSGLCPWSTFLGWSGTVLWLLYGLLAGGRLVGPVARLAAPISARLPEHQTGYELAA